jgi:hypothetical protein
MRFPRRLRLTILLAIALFWVQVCLAGTAPASPQTQTPPSASKEILPAQFGGWQIQGRAQTSTDPAVADATNAAVLKEYRFTDLAIATYTRDDGRTLKIRAARFADASGAFGAYTFYLQPEMTKQQIGDQAASAEDRVLFYRGNVLVDAQFSKESSMSADQLRELAGVLPRPSGNNGYLPSFIELLPRRGYVANTQKYVMGPAALGALKTPVTADQVDFGASAELTLADYSTPSGGAELLLISYPTPQMAADHLRRIDVAHQIAPPQPGVTAIGEGKVVDETTGGSGLFFDKRAGPIVAIVTGSMSESDAKSLLGMVNYEATVTRNAPAEDEDVHTLYSLLLNIVILCAILAALAIIAGVAFGGFRILMKRLYPDKIFDRPEQMEFISLRLTEVQVKGSQIEGVEVTEVEIEERVPGGPEKPRELPRKPS